MTRTSCPLVLSLFVLIFHIRLWAQIDYSYKGATGPAFWDKLHSLNILCSMGKKQSPILISTGDLKSDPDLPGLHFYYIREPLNWSEGLHYSSIFFHKKQVLSVGEKNWNLQRIDFHFPSEHMINGRHFAGELEFIHTGAQRERAIVSVFLKRGQRNSLIEKILLHKHKNSEKSDPKSASLQLINPKNLLPGKGTYLTYEGSLTHPPCDEGVTWYLLTQRIPLSKGQLKTMRKKHFHNARPVQPLRGRKIHKKEI